MNILLICNKSPYPPLEGGSMGMYAMIDGLLNQGHTLKVLAITSNKFNVDINKIPKEFINNTKFETIYIDLSIKPIKAFKNLFTKQSFHVQRFINKDFEDKIVQILSNNKFDIVQLETLFVAPYINLIKSYSDAKLILRAHNIEHVIWQRLAKGATNIFKKMYLTHLWRTLKHYENETAQIFDGVIAVTPVDANYFSDLNQRLKVISIPYSINNIDIQEFTPAPKPISLFHIGSMNWLPNIEGISWFLKKVWSKVHKMYPDVKLYLAGRHMPKWINSNKFKGVQVDGEVENAIKYMLEHSVIVVPLFSGSGIRIKIIEAMQAGRTVITTTIGAEGIDYTDNENILIANNKKEFIKQINFCLNNPDIIDKIGKNGQEFVKQKHERQTMFKQLSIWYNELFEDNKL